jgi:ech hydrogenase subunit D
MIDRNITTLEDSKLLDEVTRLKNEGYRLVTMSPVEVGDKLEIIYHFDKDFKTVNLRVQMDKSTPLQSISGIYFCAFLIENEIQDHFGVEFKDLVLSFGGHLYLDEQAGIRAPYCSMSIKQEDGGKK